MSCKNEEIRLRPAVPADAPALLEIYAPYVRKTAVTFEDEVPAVSVFEERIRRICTFYPYLVAEICGEAAGYAYASAFHERAAYRWSAQMSVYVREDARRRGVGRTLYAALEEILSRMHLTNLYACLGASPRGEEEHLPGDSLPFHEALGYRVIGHFHSCGNKFGLWFDVLRLEKTIGPHTDHPEEVIPFTPDLLSGIPGFEERER